MVPTYPRKQSACRCKKKRDDWHSRLEAERIQRNAEARSDREWLWRKFKSIIGPELAQKGYGAEDSYTRIYNGTRWNLCAE
jgi:hypothetical protein